MYYIAIVCPPELDKRITSFKRWMREHFGCTASLRSPAHITLVPPFWWEPAREDELIKGLQGYPADYRETEVRLNGFSHFGNRVLFVRVQPDEHLEAMRQEALSYFIPLLGRSFKVGDRPFVPHITIANRDLKPGDFIKAWDHFREMEFLAIFTASTVSLLRLLPEKWMVIAERKW
jgi:2'-5' RNA ligase